ncbi:DUF456 domain-containing protein [Streptomyces profundus]|uniref:DUF456 domain-containing protein n=1 Tax=Streptomyces profundus TaxID=2867410 RepID=UPI001D16C148|nr:DUF456 domain-containing protein [Streptomyces sp. MA3_2.13]UED87114.1 DUF456 domain-containing protein [Streptomyces sp. MA3_2.13]
MGTWQTALVGAVMLCGLLATALPHVPSTLAVWAGVFWWSSADGTTRAWWVLVGATALLLISQVVRWLLPSGASQVAEVRTRQLLFASGTGTAGFFLLPVVGAVPGFVAGLYGWERVRLGGHGSAWASTRDILRTTGRYTLVELCACLLVVGLWLAVLLLS